ncbi:MAG: class I SAM-dependent methyltransferase [Bacteroidetes bacterium]|nr:class I SAM-dependent methyltransferase [Bacteroidota bacterium]MDA1119613.1 class I SAM-dependent methyltransferase [Bacteroidota bacterium]
MNNTVKLGKLQFYWRNTEEPNFPQNPVPDFVDFSFGFKEEYQLISQIANPQTWEYLETVYKENHNVGYLQEGHDLAESYGNDFLQFVLHAINEYHPDTKTIAEVGAGGCYILNRLQKRGYDVIAIDPSPTTHERSKELGIEVIPDFYPVKTQSLQVDLIIHYDVLEHTQEPADFLAFHRQDLKKNGLIVFAVPDSSSFIERGDMSMIVHEHFNYFNVDSLANVVLAAGFEPLKITKSEYGGVLYCFAHVSDNQWQPKSGVALFDKFSRKWSY